MYALKVPARSLNDAVAAELEQLRKDAGLTQMELSAATGIPRVSLQRYLAGSRPIFIDEVALIARALGDDPSDVFARAVSRVQRDH